MTVTARDVIDFQSMLARLGGLAGRDIEGVVRAAQDMGMEGDELFDWLNAVIPDLIEEYRVEATDVATVFYGDTQGVEFSLADRRAAAEVPRRKVAGSLRAFITEDAGGALAARISGMAVRHILNGPRGYSMSDFQRHGERWGRATGPDACPFCRMLATRSFTGWGAYSSAEAAVKVGKGPTRRPKGAKMPAGSDFHDNCMCVPVKLDAYVVPDYVKSWTADYNRAVSSAGYEDLNALLKAMSTVAG